MATLQSAVGRFAIRNRLFLNCMERQLMIRVLVVDDSPTLRQLIRSILESDPELQVVGQACNGEEAIALCHRLEPDIITTDICMPKMDGFQATRHIMAKSPRPILVLTSTKSDLELGISSKALEAGALMVVGKPHGLPGEDPKADQLIAQVKAMAGVKVVTRRWRLEKKKPAPLRREPALTPSPGPVRLIAIGASTGGPPALQAILSQLPADLPVAVVQHISPGFVQGLARWLNETTPLRVKVAENGEILQPGTVYLAPDDRHLLVTAGGQARLRASPLVGGHRPSATVLFQSVAQNYGSAAVGVLLTGMGKDGAQGFKALHEAGAHTIAQDEATCVVFGMPKEAIALGAVEEVLPLEQIGARLGALMAVRKEAWS
jgi:two-component system chemotaxis response regulator CheB